MTLLGDIGSSNSTANTTSARDSRIMVAPALNILARIDD